MASSHEITKEQLTERYEMSGRVRAVAFGLIGIGIVLLLVGLLLGGGETSHATEHDSHAAATTQSYIHTVSDLQDEGDEAHEAAPTQHEGEADHGESHGEADHAEGHDEAHGEAAHEEGHDEAHGEGDHAEGHDEAHAGGAHAEGHGHDEHGHGHGGHGAVHPVDTGTRVLANILLCGFYFFAIGMGAMFFLAIHKVANGGWQAAIRRIPEAMTLYIPVAAVVFIVLLFFLDDLYDWAYVSEVGVDPIIDKKRGYLNPTFFSVRTIVILGVYSLMAIMVRRWSMAQDNAINEQEALSFFKKQGTASAIFIIFFAISYSLFAIDWMKSLEPHWFSTIYGVYVFGRSMVSSMVVMYLILAFLKSQGYMKYVNKSHFHDLGGYTFGFTVFWSYIWLAQYLLIWYSNIPEEGMYYVKRYRDTDPSYMGYNFFFYGNIIINFLIPFLALIHPKAKRNIAIYLPIGALLLYGHWHDLFNLIMPGAMRENWQVGLIEIGTFMAFAGLFIFVVFRAISQANLYARNHPYIQESVHHNTGEVYVEFDQEDALVKG